MENARIFAIGGGKFDDGIGKLLKQSLELTDAQKPNVLIIPTARPTEAAFEQSMQTYGSFYRNTLGLPTRVLHAFGQIPSKHTLEEKIEEADVIYINGGDTATMMGIWRDHGIDELLKKRALGGVVLSGVSAGAIAPFQWGHSDSPRYKVDDDKPWDYIPVSGLGLINAGVTPHNNTTPTIHQTPRAEMFKNMFAEQSENFGTRYGFGIDNNAAVCVISGELSVRNAANNASVTLLTCSADRVTTERLGRSAAIPLSELG